MQKSEHAFHTIYKQNKNRIHYHLYKLGIPDPHNEFYTEGMYAMWTAYKKYEPHKEPMPTYFNYTIRYRLLDMLRKKTTQLRNWKKTTQLKQANIDNGNHYNTHKFPIVDKTDITIQNKTFWKFIQSRLTENQWKWVHGHIIHGLTQHEIAAKEHVTLDAVKSWARQTRQKLFREEDTLKNML